MENMEKSTSKHRNILLPNFSYNFQTDAVSSSAEPIPYSCSFKSIESGLTLHKAPTKPAIGKKDTRKLLHKIINEKSTEKLLQDVDSCADLTTDIWYIASTTQR